MTSTNYQIKWDTLSSGGSDTSTSATYNLRDTVGGTGIGGSTSTNYQDSAGYRAGVNDQVITYDLFAENPSTAVAASDLTGTTVIVANSTGYNTGDFAAVVQDVGASQITAIGKITSTTNTTIVFDTLANGGTPPTIDGVNDKVYLLSGTSAPLGTLTSLTLATEIVGFNVTSDVDNGYTIQVISDGELRSGANHVNPVADGAVTIGQSEYGARSSDTAVVGSTFDTQDTAFTTSYQPVVDATGHRFEDRSFVTLKAAVTTVTPNGSYAQSLAFVVSGNY